MSNNYQLGLTTADEVQPVALPVTGALPLWLRGTLIRNGPGKFEVGARQFRHWFDGLALLHRFAIADGQVDYASKFIQSPAYTYAREHDRIGYAEFATDPCRSIFKRVMTLFSPEFGHNTCVNVTRLADTFVALTETPLPIEFDPETLETRGLLRFADEVEGVHTTPHPHLDPCGEDALNYTVAFGKTSCYQLYRVDPHAPRRTLIASLPVAEPAYIHSFGVTESWLVLVEYPLVVNPLKMLLNGKSFAQNMHWRPEQPARFLVFDKRSGALAATYEAPAFFCFHHVNAFEQDGAILVDLLAYPDATVIDRLYLDALRHPHADRSPSPLAQLRRYRLTPGATTADYTVLSTQLMELPRINYRRCNGRPYRYVYATGLNAARPTDFVNQLVKVDMASGTDRIWFEPGCYPGEPVFVAAPDAQAEDEGVVLSVVLDGARGRSFLLALDGQSFAEIARAAVPAHVPFGFHGEFFRGV